MPFLWLLPFLGQRVQPGRPWLRDHKGVWAVLLGCPGIPCYKKTGSPAKYPRADEGDQTEGQLIAAAGKSVLLIHAWDLNTGVLSGLWKSRIL